MNDPIASPANLTQLVDYQTGSVVSRVLLKNPGGVMTVFAFAEGEGLTEHSSPHDAAILLLEGQVQVSIGQEQHTVGTGEMLRLPAGVPHALHGGTPFKMLLLIFRKTVAS